MVKYINLCLISMVEDINLYLISIWTQKITLFFSLTDYFNYGGTENVESVLSKSVNKAYQFLHLLTK